VKTASSTGSSASVQCASGKIALGGGGSTATASSSLFLSAPLNSSGTLAADGETPTGWKAEVKGNNPGVTVYVICAS
jgi:hypothetical protein